MTMIRPRSDVVYGICRGLPSGMYDTYVTVKSCRHFNFYSHCKKYKYRSIHEVENIENYDVILATIPY